MEESQFDLDGFISDRRLEDMYEGDMAFSDEIESITLARLDWMLTKQRAAFVVMASELGLDAATVAKLSTAQQMLSRYFSDFVSIGIDAVHNLPPLYHPLDEIFNVNVDEIVEPNDESVMSTIVPIQTRMLELLEGADEDLLHQLDKLRPPAEA